MSAPLSSVDRIAKAVLYEGYVLYPYRRSSIRNQHRWNFGVLYPEQWAAQQTGSDRSWFEMQIPFTNEGETKVDTKVRFLHLGRRASEDSGWQEAIERCLVLESISLHDLLGQGHRRPFTFAHENADDLKLHRISGLVELRAVPGPDLGYILTARVSNSTDFEGSDRAEALSRSLASAHICCTIEGGAFISVTDPPEAFEAAAKACQNSGVWPVLVGERRDRTTILGSPIILGDYPQVAAESAGDLYDATEIDEILTLRILTLTDSEKAEVRDTSDRSRRLLDRAESLSGEDLLRLHGAFREARQANAWSAWDSGTESTRVESIRIGNVDVKAGDRVRLRPGRRADAIDTLMAGKIAIVETIERDLEDNMHLAVVLEDDPGRDLGMLRQSGHRFFFAPDEVEPLTS